MSEKISIIVPIYKVEPFLDQCVESLVNQTYTNLEIILVDDGSPDNCPAMCDQWAKKDERIKVVHKKNGGLSDARNAGLSIATGDYVAFLDSDDWVNTHFYEVLYSEMCRSNCDIVCGGYTVVSTRESVHIPLPTGEAIVLDSSQALSELIGDGLVRQVVWNKLYKREVIANVLFAVGKCHEDEFWSYQIIGNAKKIAVVDFNGYCYYQRPDSIMGVGFSVKRLDSVEAKAQRQEYLQKHYPDLAAQGVVNLYFTCMYLGQQAIRTTDKNNTREIISVLSQYISDNRISFETLKAVKADTGFWLLLSRVSLRFVCSLRNKLRIGF